MNAGSNQLTGASSTFPFYIGTCAPVSCPSNSVGTLPTSGCTCAAGYQAGAGPGNTLAAAGTSPFYTPIEGCQRVVCPASVSSGTTVVDTPPCSCSVPGFTGSIIATSTAPDFYTDLCIPVLCSAVANSVGVDVPTSPGCLCSAGYCRSDDATSNVIAAASVSPFYAPAQGCVVAACPSNTFSEHRVGTPTICHCLSGYMNAGSNQLTGASSTFPFYIGTCTPVPCPTGTVFSNGVSVPEGCYCNAGYSGTISG